MDEHKPRRMPWFRFYHDALTDHKMIQLSNAAWGYWLKLLCLANQQNPRGSIYYGEKNFGTLYEKILNISLKSSEKFLKKFEELGLIHFDEDNECLVITNWKKRQFDWDDATARKRKSRELSRARERAMSRGRAEQNRADKKQRLEQNNVSGSDNDTDANDAFKDLNKTLPTLDQVPNDTDDIETWSKINAIKSELKTWWPKVGDFIGRANKMNKHPGAILQALERCYEKNPRDPFAYCWKILQIESGNKYYEDFQKEAETHKQELEEMGNDWNSNRPGNLDQW